MPKTLSEAGKQRAPRKKTAVKKTSSGATAESKPASGASAARKKPTTRKAALKRPRKPRAQARSEGVAALAAKILEDMKAQDVRTLDVRHLTSVTDTMVIASGRSDRHVRAIADALLERCKAAGYPRLGVEGQDSGEWVLVDLGDAIVHVMLPRVREFYNIEGLWDIAARDTAVT